MKAHARASRAETMEQKCHRRGNDVADRYANLGRELHFKSKCDKKCIDNLKNADSNTAGALTCSVCFDNIISRTKYLIKYGAKWATWVGVAATAQHDKERTCDHSRREGLTLKTSRKKQCKPALPSSSTVLRRFP